MDAHSSTNNAVQGTSDGNGHLTLYRMESPEYWFEDFGSARLSGGSAKVAIDPEFAQTVHTADYHVFVQAEVPAAACSSGTRPPRGS